MGFWDKELRKETQRYNREYNREYKTEKNLWFYQSSGSREIDYIKENQLQEAIKEYQDMENWN